MKKTITVLVLVCSSLLFGQTPNHPFPNHTTYTGTHIKPSNYTQAELDNQTKAFYDKWKAEYLKNDCGNSDEYYVLYSSDAKTVSEAHGYGMMLTAFFAGYDTNAQTYFDGLYNWYKAHPSNINSDLMDWQQVGCNDDPSSDDDAASDGDIDIAFALLLADAQWGSDGDINYKSKAKKIITAIKKNEINQDAWTVKLGDWCDSDDSKYYYSTRISDFIIDHFRVFASVMDDDDWDKVADACYSLVGNMQTNYSSSTGLLPDFIINVNSTPKPSGAGFLESKYDGGYSYNSCRAPWRLGTDYLLSGDNRAKQALNKINTWLKSKTSGDPSKISNGYKLDGTKIPNEEGDAAFIAPFTVGAMADINNKTWFNNLYEHMLTNNTFSSGGYYSNSIKLFSMLVISGNYWVPNYNAPQINHYKTEQIKASNISLNNTKGIISINFDSSLKSKKKMIIITDATGKILKRNKLLKSNQQINISSFSNGVYFISVMVDNVKLATKKIIKNRID